MRALAVLLLLAACDSPAPTLRGAERHEVERNGRRYVLYQTDTTAEVIRLGPARRGQHTAIRAEMVDMIPVVTGCRVDPASVRGDSGELRARLRCPQAP